MIELAKTADLLVRTASADMIAKLFRARRIRQSPTDQQCYQVWPQAPELPRMVLEVPQVYYLDRQGELLSPLYWFRDPEFVKSLRLRFNGAAEFAYGDWLGFRGGRRYFRLALPRDGTALLLRISWDKTKPGYYDATRTGATRRGASYFCRSEDDSAGTGYDFWVLSINRFAYRTQAEPYVRDSLLQVSREMHQDEWDDHVRREQILLNDLREYEAQVDVARAELLPQLEELQQRIWRMHQSGHRELKHIRFEEKRFVLDGRRWLYTPAALKIAEIIVCSHERLCLKPSPA